MDHSPKPSEFLVVTVPPERVHDYPVAEVMENMERLAEAGFFCYVKYNCSCGSRQTSDEANTWRKDGYICSECGVLNKPDRINFLLSTDELPVGMIE